MKTRLLLRSSLALAFLLMPLAARAVLTLGPIFSDHAVLQCDRPLPVWGHGTPGDKVVVAFHEQEATTTVGADGRWLVRLAPLAASAQPAELLVATARERVVVRDVLVGEVWLASGQSNMEWPVDYLAPDERKLAAVDLPLVRQVKIVRTVGLAPADAVPTSAWEPATPRTVGGFTAVGYFFARELERKLHVPIGIINCTWGATAIEAWMSDASRTATPFAATLEARWEKERSEWPPERVARYDAEMAAWTKAEERARVTQTKNPLPWPQPPAMHGSPTQPGGLYNGMIAPLRLASIRGIVWYQGESNVGRDAEYAVLFQAMIRDWRRAWGDPTLPFYFVQLPNFADNQPDGQTWARLREAQAKALELPATGMAVAIDIGDPEDIHPLHKREVGRRLALIAMGKLYGGTAGFSGPVFAGATSEGGAMRVGFTHAAEGLVAHDRPVQALELAGADRVFHPATAKIAGDTMLVSSPLVPAPVAVRYAWSNAPAANLYNGAGLPAEPFRSDDW